MTVASAATSQCKKAMKMGLSLFRRGFSSSKCKTMAKMAVARMKLLRNKREVVVRQMRRDIAMLLESRQDATARVRVEHVIREQNIMAANEFLELFCELIVSRLTIIAKQRECPADLKEGISSLIFAAPRCSDIPELVGLRDVFEKKYGKDFVIAATDLRPNAGVNRKLIEKLSVRTPPGEVKLKVLKEIAKEYKVEWDTTESEMELLKPPEKLTDGPSTFVSASSLPLKSNTTPSLEPKNATSSSSDVESNKVHFTDPASAAQAAAESAKRAIAAAEVAAYLANKDTHEGTYNNTENGGSSGNSCSFGSMVEDIEDQIRVKNSARSDRTHPLPTKVDAQRAYRRHTYNNPPAHSDIKFDESDYDEEIEADEPPCHNGLQPDRRHSYNVSSAAKYDESDYENEETDMDQRMGGSTAYKPPIRPAPHVPKTYVKQNSVPRIHPKLPDYDDLAARFESLKYHKSARFESLKYHKSPRS